MYEINWYILAYINKKEKTNVLVNRTKKRKYNDIEDDVKDEMAKKFEQEKERNIRMNCLKPNEFDILKLQNDETYYEQKSLFREGIVEVTLEPIINI